MSDVDTIDLHDDPFEFQPRGAYQELYMSWEAIRIALVAIMVVGAMSWLNIIIFIGLWRAGICSV